LVLVEGSFASLAQQLAETALRFSGEKLGLMLPEGIPAPAAAAAVFPWGRWLAPDEMARDLYSGLRALDAEGCTVILCPLPPAEGIGAAIVDRLRKAARSKKE
jgi:L-threonylcarbamoyladenylate synthase